MTSGQEHFDTVIIGGGQAGLAVGHHLARLERSFVILDAHDRIGDAWRRRWDSLLVFTPARYNGLPGWSFPAAAWSYPSKDDIADYLEAYAARFGLPVRTGVRVDGVRRDGDAYVVTAGPHRYRAANVVVATGAYDSPRIPAFAADLDPSITQLHSSAYRNQSQLRAGSVLVVGAGNSGAEIALESSAGHRTWLSGRDTGQEPFRPGGGWDRLFTPVFWFMLSRVFTLRTPIGRKVRDQLSDRGLPIARARREDLRRAGVERVARVSGVRDGRPALDDGTILDPANVVWCTGFRPDFGWIDLPVFGPDGRPRHERGVVGAAPGLYFVGLFFQSTAASPLIGGVGRDARHIARTIGATREAVLR
jgi:putative flavoprotein involved in K+ transport